ncbi:MAG: hypothetical protein RI564_12745, partial [Gracilimonas sp.]|nr:hypothetical protein [Gracilimonas sp.]
MHRLTGFWALLFIFIGIGFTAQAQTVTGSDTLFIEGGSWEFFDFSSEMAFTIADTGSFDADIRGSSNEGVNFGQEFSSAVRDSAIQLLGMGSVDTVTSAPAWKETGTWVTTSWESTGFQPIQVGQLWAVYTAEGHYAVMEITALPEGDFGSSFAFDYVYQTDGTRFFDGSGEPVATAPTTNPADPMPRDTADIVSIYGDTYNTISGINYNPDWGQSGINDVDPSFDPGTGNPVLAYPNFNYQGTELNGSFDLSNMDYIHIDIWVAEGTDRMVKFTPVDNSGNGPGEVLVEVPVTPGSWNSVDLPKSAFGDMSWESVFQLKFDGQFNADGSANTEPFDI